MVRIVADEAFEKSVARKDQSDEDPVTAEYDVFITPELQEQLFLFQFPNRDRERPYNAASRNKPVEMRVKPRSGFVEVDVPLNTNFHYDKRKAQTWSKALAKSKAEGSTGHGISAGFASSSGLRAHAQRSLERGGAERDSDTDDEAADLSCQTLGGRIISHERGKPVYMVGAFRGSELHLTKLDGMVQLRPQFHHVDAKMQIERNKVRREREVLEPPRPAEPRLVQQTVKPSNYVDHDFAEAKAMLQLAHEESWSRLKYHEEEEELAYNQYHNKLFLAQTKRTPKLAASMDGEAYLEMISAPRVDSRGRTRVKPLAKKQRVQVELSESEESEADEETS